jgi:hypothetical protein
MHTKPDCLPDDAVAVVLRGDAWYRELGQRSTIPIRLQHRWLSGVSRRLITANYANRAPYECIALFSPGKRA